MAGEANPERRKLVLIGGGEHAKVVLDAARIGHEWSVIGFVDPDPRPDFQALGPAWMGDDDAAAATLRGRHCILAVGGIAETNLRIAIAHRYDAEGVTWATVVHPRAIVARDATVGPGATILAGSVVNPGAHVGPHCIVNTGAIIEHDVDLDAFVHIGPGAVVGGGTTIGRGAYVGLGARVRDHIRVGEGAVIGMGAVVVGDIPDGTVVIGMPARPIRKRRAPIVPAASRGK
jgi:sugar O-acyltransferase (sialic acid O-acetyltransferase NeuD family)